MELSDSCKAGTGHFGHFLCFTFPTSATFVSRWRSHSVLVLIIFCLNGLIGRGQLFTGSGYCSERLDTFGRSDLIFWLFTARPDAHGWLTLRQGPRECRQRDWCGESAQ
ncbi:hypothetical protein J6590_104093 [Homalodisca vitripennis]|nr:hypothetical protein J6590_104093 [Homalodisca vitripennis]